MVLDSVIPSNKYSSHKEVEMQEKKYLISKSQTMKVSFGKWS